MNDTAVSILVPVTIFGLPVLVFAWRNWADRVELRKRLTPEALAKRSAEAWREHERRVCNPDWKFCEQYLQRSVPQALRELYTDRALIVSRDLRYSESKVISLFHALDKESIVQSRGWLDVDAIAFGTTNDGLIYLRSGPSEPDAVFITYFDRDEDDEEEFAPDLPTFVQRLHHANRIT